jgi:hypothetical protein
LGHNQDLHVVKINAGLSCECNRKYETVETRNYKKCVHVRSPPTSQKFMNSNVTHYFV